MNPMQLSLSKFGDVLRRVDGGIVVMFIGMGPTNGFETDEYVAPSTTPLMAGSREGLCLVLDRGFFVDMELDVWPIGGIAILYPDDYQEWTLLS